MHSNIQLLLGSTVQVISHHMEAYKEWMEAHLGCALDQSVTLACPNLLGEAIGSSLLSGIDIVQAQQNAVQPWCDVIDSWELPPGISPRVQLSHYRVRRGSGNNALTWSYVWQDCPVALHLKEGSVPIIALNIPMSFPGDRNQLNHLESCLVVRRQDVAVVWQSIRQAVVGHERVQKIVRSNGADLTLTNRYCWDDLVLDPQITRLVRRDFELFFEREAWFRAHRLPFRRGYLLYGPPGNGKSSVIKIMAAHPLIEPYVIKFDDTNLDDDGVANLFEQAHRSAPALMIMEDLDRIFPKGKTHSRGVSFQALLNCLDGVGTQDGLIVVATANDPTALDAAILDRPGRFDRAVAFPAPNQHLRRRYWKKLNPELMGEVFEEAVVAADGFSFAQLRETYILAGQLAFEVGSEITSSELLQALNLQRSDARNVRKARPARAGFSAQAAPTAQPMV